jgi:hypothetical protein
MRFYLGIGAPHWLELTSVPVFLSRNAFLGRKSYPRACGEWALDSGGFTEVSRFGGWRTPAKEFAAQVRTIKDEVGKLSFAAPQDWMCEPMIIHGGKLPDGTVVPGSGLSVTEHQRRTVRNFLELRAIAPDIPWIPVLQGWTPGEYWDCVEEYDRAGIDLRKEKLVGLGTVCRRQHTGLAYLLIRQLADYGIKMHGFGLKFGGLVQAADALASADSYAWSFGAWKRGSPGDRNDLLYALQWRADLFAKVRAEGGLYGEGAKID